MGLRANGRTKHPTPRSALVEDAPRRKAPLLPVSPPLPHRRRVERILLHPQEYRRQALQSRLRAARGPASRPDRKEAPQPLPTGNQDSLARNGGLQHGLLLLPELGHLKIQGGPGQLGHLEPEAVVQTAIKHGCPSIAFTYNEPTIWGEYVIDIAKAAHRQGLKTVMVTNGYITPEALFDVYEHIDAANVDLKAFTEEFYAKITLTHLAGTLEALKLLREKTSVWIELTTLLIPTLNDSSDEIERLSDWILENLGDETPLHFTAFHPDFKLRDKPHTPPETIHAARRIARERGLKFVYEGNIHSDGGHTLCPGCGREVIRRSWHRILEYQVGEDGSCAHCGHKIKGYFTLPSSLRDNGGDVPRSERETRRGFRAF